MENKKTFLASSVIASAILGLTGADATALTNYSDLGSGAQLRTELLGESSSEATALELKCGEHKCGEKDSTATDNKAKEHKCGEGKCGEESTEKDDHKEGDAAETEEKKEN